MKSQQVVFHDMLMFTTKSIKRQFVYVTLDIMMVILILDGKQEYNHYGKKTWIL